MSNLPASDHVVWKLLRLLIVGLILLGMLSFTYNQFDRRDIVTIVTALLGLAGYDTAKSLVTKPRDEDGRDAPPAE